MVLFLVVLELDGLHGRTKVEAVWNNIIFTLVFWVNDPFNPTGTLHLQNIITAA